MCCILLGLRFDANCPSFLLPEARKFMIDSHAGFAYNMLNCVDVPVAVPVERWDVENVKANSETLQSNMLRFGAFMDDAASFDSTAFRMAHGEAVGLDPQSRILLEGTYNAMQVGSKSLLTHLQKATRVSAFTLDARIFFKIYAFLPIFLLDCCFSI